MLRPHAGGMRACLRRAQAVVAPRELPKPSLEVAIPVKLSADASSSEPSSSSESAAAQSGQPAFTIPESPIWRAYAQALSKRPLLTKCFTSLIGFMIGDVIAQTLTTGDFDPWRCAVLASYGFVIDAPAGHVFYQWLDDNIWPGQPKEPRAVFSKIAIDQLLYAPVFTCVLYAYLSALHGDAADVTHILQTKVLPTLMANYAIWPLAHGLNFYFVPTEQRILYNNFVGVCWTTWLSYLAH